MLKRVLFVLILLFLGGSGLVSVFLSDSGTETKVSFLDVGQGDSILIRTEEGKNILIDGGPDKRVVKELSRQLAWKERSLDIVILTHPHLDHLVGLNSVVERFDVGKFFLPPAKSSSPAFKHLIETLSREGVPAIGVVAPLEIEISPACNLVFLHPKAKNLPYSKLNDVSIVNKLECDDFSFLLTGDIERQAERDILSQDMDLESDVLKVAHHGSDTSSKKDFLKAVSPDLAVIQVGEDNNLGHPSLRTIRNLERIGSLVLRNDKHGTVTVIERDGQWEVVTEN